MIPVVVLVSTIVLPVLVGVGVLHSGASLAAGFAVFTVVVAEAVVTLPSTDDDPNPSAKFVLVTSSLAACVVLILELRLAALPVMAAPMLAVFLSGVLYKA